jgi:eukaryotic-like serine/threonine-protein kinase
VTLSSGTRLGPYELGELLGAGGMGEVYKARDTRLERSVAVKVLSSHLSSTPAFRERFDREAKAISAISHPSICALFDVGTSNDLHYLVMEYLEGESLADRLTRGPLPLDQVFRYGVEIASALDKAHRAGIVHRDLKPGNIMITKAGAKLLDFGLAKYAHSGPGPEVLQSLATEHKPLTQEGTILGTFQYMSPEQLAGDEADARSDIFALGAVLYEMLTGVRAFHGKNKTSLIGAIVSGEPRPVSALQPLTPPALEHVIKKCLAKEPDDRLQSAHDIAEELKWISEAGSQAGVATPFTVKRKTRERLAWSIAAILAAGLGLAGILTFRRVETPLQFYRTSLVLPSYLDYYSGPMAISPDGKAVAYAAPNEGGQRILWIRRFDEAAPHSLPATIDASSPFWSPDGQTVGYFTFRKLNRISAAGGQPEVIADASGGAGATWNRQGVVLFSPNVVSPILRVPASGGDAVALTHLEKLGHRAHRWPYFLPDGKRFLFLALRAPGGKAKEGIYLGSIDSKDEPKFLTAADSNAVYVEPGQLVFGREGVLRVQKVDVDRGVMLGEPASVTPLQYSSRFNAAMFSATPSALIYQEKGTEAFTELQWVDRQGKVLGTAGPPAYYWSPRISHDGKRIAVDKSASSGRGDIWIVETTRVGATRFTFDEANESVPIWTPGDEGLLYMISPEGAARDVLLKPLKAGSAPEKILGDPVLDELPNDVSPDGRNLLVGRETTGGGFDIYIYSTESKSSTPFLTSAAAEDSALFSPDGNWVAYASDESGRNEVYVQSFPTPAAQWQISTSGGSMPRWSRDGKELFFVSAEGNLMSMPVKIGESFEAGAARALFPVRLRTNTLTEFDVAADGTRFLLNSIAPKNDPPLPVLINWQVRYKP